MDAKTNTTPIILIVEDDEETRDCTQKLLERDGYFVEAARNEGEAIANAQRTSPALILVSLSGTIDATDVVETARRIRARADLDHGVVVVIFCVDTLDEGAEVSFDDNVHVTRPDNFDQLRKFINRLLHKISAVT